MISHSLTEPAQIGLLRGESLRQQATRAIRAAIVTGSLEPGTVYSARGLSSRFGVSATPVREAMLDLVNEGLLVSVPNKGFRIVELSDHDLDEIFELRVLLEIPAIRQRAGRLQRDHVDALSRLVADCSRSARAGDLTGFLAADREFHLYLLQLGGNRRLTDLVGQLRDQSRLYGLRSLVTESLTASSEEHVELLKALVEGDADLAEDLMRTHLRHTRGLWAGIPEPGT